jgi:hypothetical protein
MKTIRYGVFNLNLEKGTLEFRYGKYVCNVRASFETAAAWNIECLLLHAWLTEMPPCPLEKAVCFMPKSAMLMLEHLDAGN